MDSKLLNSNKQSNRRSFSLLLLRLLRKVPLHGQAVPLRHWTLRTEDTFSSMNFLITSRRVVYILTISYKLLSTP
jgi:hypothetical protein